MKVLFSSIDTGGRAPPLGFPTKIFPPVLFVLPMLLKILLMFAFDMLPYLSVFKAPVGTSLEPLGMLRAFECPTNAAA